MKWPDQDEPPACARLHNWLNRQDARGQQSPAVTPAEARTLLESSAQQLTSARRPLIWLESTDVHTARSAVQLATATGATLHVAQSPGAEITAAVLNSDGWLGTTLAEVGSTAALVIHVGKQHLRASPMLELRFANPQAQHLFLDDCPDSWNSDEQLRDATLQLNWSKDQWLDGLSRTLLVLSDQSTALEREADQIDRDAGLLAEMLLGSHYTVILWSEDELADELDMLCVRRLLELSRYVSRTNRCSLLALSQDPGRVTAKDTVLWLTNHTGPMRYSGQGWIKEWLPHESLQQWQQAFDWIMAIRTLPSDRPLPELTFDLVIDAHCNQHVHEWNGSVEQRTRWLPVAAVGVDAVGDLLRADHGLAARIDCVSPEASAHVVAATLLDQLTELCQGLAKPAIAAEQL